MRRPRDGGGWPALGALGLALLLTGCGELFPGRPDSGADAGDLLARLRALPGVTVEEHGSTRAPAPYRYLTLRFLQPVDHFADGGPSFEQQVSLLHRDLGAPTVAVTTGYWDWQLDALAEPTRLASANQVSIEHRFFGASRPNPADWSALTIEQMAADEHRIIQTLRAVYPGAWISTGASKGGMTAVFHRRSYPDDVAGTLAYSAPLSFGAPDHRYDAFLDGVKPTACRDAVRAVARELLQHRFDALLATAAQDAQLGGYHRVDAGPGLESAILDLEWSYWQYRGPADCALVPSPTASDAELWGFLEDTSPVEVSQDRWLAAFEAYYFQAYAQLGTPGLAHARGDSIPAGLVPYLRYQEADYRGTLPLAAPVPTLDPVAMQDIDTWVRTRGQHLIFLYGEVDPWSAGAFRLGDAGDALLAVAPGGTHGASIASLAAADRQAVARMLSAWTGVPVSVGKVEPPVAPFVDPRDPTTRPATR